MLIGSTEWFYEKSLEKKHSEFQNHMEMLRQNFLDKFSPDKLSAMSDSELVKKVFGPNNDSMMNLLIRNDDYKEFGSITQNYTYLGILYYKDGEGWKLYGSNHDNKSFSVESSASNIRDELLSCIKVIKKYGNLASIDAYGILDKELHSIKSSHYVTFSKYYQMVFPWLFPGMYAERTLSRAIGILGLTDHGKSHLFENIGEISLFIRECNINNMAFNDIYSDEWGWEKPVPPCEAAEAGKNKIYEGNVDKDYSYLYCLGKENETEDNNCESQIREIEDDIDLHELEGYDREVVAKARVNQGAFRDRLYHKYKKCCICGVTDINFLVASHIKPWAASDSEEKVNVNNGLLLCPNHDKLFDGGYITFDDEGQIIISDSVSDTNRIFLNLRPSMKIDMTEEQKKFMKYHRENIFKG